MRSKVAEFQVSIPVTRINKGDEFRSKLLLECELVEPVHRQFVLPFEIRSRLYDWLYEVQFTEVDSGPSVDLA